MRCISAIQSFLNLFMEKFNFVLRFTVKRTNKILIITHLYNSNDFQNKENFLIRVDNISIYILMSFSCKTERFIIRMYLRLTKYNRIIRKEINKIVILIYTYV
ncbi:hypothetical protein BpHYR1_016385 [Brachionus plicatilis]|uniref:Uncharacterized protein n=1 Tax=Brachionus plicatilis TaxID=10195 RepID=A0A3M7SWN7_BRAPC|nr:hypothetical protein BpHYR1_016385 [Brachionus plicatilis]